MSVLKFENGVVTEPYSYADLRRDHPNIGAQRDYLETATDEELSDLNLFRIAETPRPSGDIVTPAASELVGDTWTRKWSSRAFTQEEVDTRLAKQRNGMSVTMSQAQRAMVRSGITRAKVNDIISAIPDPLEREEAEIQWSTEGTVRRNDPLVAGIGAALGLSDADIDNLFVVAAGI